MNEVTYFNRVIGTLIAAGIGLIVGLTIIMLATSAHAESPGCLQPSIAANTPMLEAQGNAAPQNRPAAGVTGVLTLQNPAPETTDTNTYNKKGKLLTSTVSLAPKAHVTVTVSGSSAVAHEYTVNAGTSVGIPWVTSANALFQVEVQSDQPLNCTGSDWIVDGDTGAQ